MATGADLAGTVDGRAVRAVRADAGADGDGIRRGDVLLVGPESAAEAGATVVALIDGRLRVRRLVWGAHGRRELLPVDPHVLPLALPAERARLIGPLVGVLRQRRARETTPASLPTAAERNPQLRLVDDALDDAAHTVACRDARVREVARDLRSLRDCYVGTSVPRLRQALLREAESCARRLRLLLAAENRRSA